MLVQKQKMLSNFKPAVLIGMVSTLSKFPILWLQEGNDLPSLRKALQDTSMEKDAAITARVQMRLVLF